MTTTPLPCFHAASLRTTFARQVALARPDDELTQAECDGLLQLCLHPWQPPTELRIDRLSAVGWNSHEFADALMISSTDSSVKTVYLSLPLHAVERFGDRHALHQALRERYAQGAIVEVDGEHLQSSPFDYWMSQFLDRQQGYVERLDDTLLKLPTLRSVLRDTLEADLTRLTPSVESDPESWRWHVTSIINPDEVQQTHSLLEVALDEFCSVRSPEGTRLQLLDPQGRLLTAPRQQQYAETFNNSINRLNAPFEQSLLQYWQRMGSDDTPHAAFAARALAHLYYLALLKAVHSGTLASADILWLRHALRPAAAQGSLTVHSIALHSGLRADIDVAGAFALTQDATSPTGLYLFSARDGLRHFPGADSSLALVTWLTGTEQQVLLDEAIGLTNHQPYTAMKRVEVRLTAITSELFGHRVQSIIALQRDNLAAAIAQRGKIPEQVATRLDDALDMRGLLAPALLSLSYSPRWSVPANARDSTHWTDHETGDLELSDLQDWSGLIRQAQPGLETCVRYLIDRQLALCGYPQFNAGDLWVPCPVVDSADESSRETLLSHALRQLGTSSPAPLQSDWVISAADSPTVTRLDASLLNHLLTRVAGQTRNAWVRQFNRYYSQPQRIGASQLMAHDQLLSMRQNVLRAERVLARDSHPDKPWIRTWLGQILERPTRAMRMELGEQRIEVNRVSIGIPGTPFAIPLSNVMALTRAEVPDGNVLLCSHLLGVMAFSNLAEFQAEISRLFRDPLGGDAWLGLVSERYRATLSAYLSNASALPLNVQLSLVEGDYAQYLQRSEETRQVFSAQSAFSRAIKADYPAPLLLAYVDQSAAPLALAGQLDELANTLKGNDVKKQLPSWITKASLADLLAYGTNLQRLRISLAAPVDYLFGIESAIEYATEQLWAFLTVDFPEAVIDPAQVRVRVAQKFSAGMHFSAASAGLISAGGVSYPILDMSLVDYSLQRAIAAADVPIEVSMSDGSEPIDGLTPDYVMQMVRSLDTGGRYLRRLEKRFSSSDAHYGQRRSLFSQHVPATLMDAAFEGKLKGELSAAAFQIIENLVEMPDAMARQTPPATHCNIRPLCLLAAKGLAADTVAGLFLLGAKPAEPGPLVLMATFNQSFLFREYRDEHQLMEKMRASGDLQDLVLDRVALSVRSRYTHGGLTVARLQVSDATPFEQPLPQPEQTWITYQPVPGNTLTFLFEESLKFLIRLAKAQIVTSAQADHAANVSLVKLLLETGFTFVSGRVALAVSLWQSAEWLKSSVTSVITQDWGRAVSQLGAALLILATQRRPRQERLSSALAAAAPEVGVVAEYAGRFSDIPLDIRARLREFEVTDVALTTLAADTTSGIYHDHTTKKSYCPVAGMVFEVRKLEGTWTIVGDRREGPSLHRNAKGQLEINLARGLLGGGGGASRQRPDKLQAVLDATFISQATGMPEIRLTYPGQANRIAAAQLRAKRYMERCMDALEVPRDSQDIPAQSRDILKDFFAVATPSARLIAEVRKMAAGIFAELMDASLNTYTSPRYVTGINKLGYTWVVAFTARTDPQRRIFLTETFFDIPHVLRGVVRDSQRRFDVPEHFRATTLIHELSHLVLGTEDLAYIESSAPYLDMIDDTRPDGKKLIALIINARNQALNANTPAEQLFTVKEAGRQRDLNKADAPAYQRVLELSATHNLADARKAFVNDEHVREKIILANADSLALLITLLARNVPSPP